MTYLSTLNNETPVLISVSSGSVAVHPDASVQLLAEEATLVENLDAKVKID